MPLPSQSLRKVIKAVWKGTSNRPGFITAWNRLKDKRANPDAAKWKKIPYPVRKSRRTKSFVRHGFPTQGIDICCKQKNWLTTELGQEFLLEIYKIIQVGQKNLQQEFRSIVMHFCRIADRRAYLHMQLADVGLDNLAASLIKYDKECPKVIQAQLRVGANNVQPMEPRFHKKFFQPASSVYKIFGDEEKMKAAVSRFSGCLRRQNIADLLKYTTYKMVDIFPDNHCPKTGEHKPIIQVNAWDCKPGRKFPVSICCDCSGDHNSKDCQFEIVKQAIELHHKNQVGENHPLFMENDKAMTATTWKRYLNNYCDDVGIPRITHHKLRVSITAYGRFCCDVDVHDLQLTLNHANTKTTLKYCKPIPNMAIGVTGLAQAKNIQFAQKRLNKPSAEVELLKNENKHLKRQLNLLMAFMPAKKRMKFALI